MSIWWKKTIGIFTLFLLFAINANSQDIDAYTLHFDTQRDGISVSNNGYDISILYSIQQLSFRHIISDNGEYVKISVPNHISTTTPGEPELPIYSSLIVIPDDGNYSINISDIRYEEFLLDEYGITYPIYPSQEETTKSSIQSSENIYINKTSYLSEGFLEHDTVAIDIVGKVRGTTMATMTISPIFYNPKRNSLCVITNMDIEISFSGGASQPSEISAISDVLKRAAINYNANEVVPEYTETPLRMVILTDTTLSEALRPFIQWKHQKGIETILLFKGDVSVGTTDTEMRNALANLYNSNLKPDYLLIVGNTDIIPNYSASSFITDLYYGEYDGGDDYIPDVLIGRIPASNAKEVVDVTSKIIQYEKMEFPDNGTYLRDALVFAGVDATYEDFMNGHINYAINNYLTNENNINEHHSYVGESQKDSILNIINNGVSFVNYTGHGNPNTWLNVNISSRDTSLLLNCNKYPVIISNACQTSKFNVGSLGNSMVLAKQKGAVAFIGSSHDTYWSEDFFWAVGTGTPGLNPTYDNTGRGAYDRLFHTHNEPPTEWYRSLGQILYSGNLSVSSSSSNRKKRYWEIYNIVGDPSLIPYIGDPRTLNISIPDTLPNNITSLSLRGEPFAYIAISHNDTLLAASHFNQAGIATLTIPDMANDSCLVVVTGQNIRPIIKKIYIDESNSEYVSLSSYSFSETEGDHDQLLEHGETISVNVNVKNIGNKATTNLRAYLRSSSEWVSIIDSTHYIGSLSAQDSILFSDCFSFKIADSIPDNYFVHFEIVLKDDYDEKHYGIEAKIHAPILNIINCRIDDSELGNGNNIIESGESFEIIYTVTNTGSEPATVSLVSTCDNSAIVIQNIAPFSLNDSSTHIIRLRISQNTTLPLGTRIHITSTIRCSHISSNTITSSIQIGGAIESFESENFSSFPWMTDRENPWIITSSTAVEGLHSAQTGSISNDQSTSLSILCLYEQADTISFYYKVSTEYLYDLFTFSINGNTQLITSGNSDWQLAKYAVSEGLNSFKWTYRKDESISSNDDCVYIDFINFANTLGVTFLTNDLSLDSIYLQTEESSGLKDISADITNNGINAIQSFNLAYIINDGSIICEHFDVPILSGETVNVTFDTQADFQQIGDYLFEVFLFDNDDEYRLNDTIRKHITIIGNDISIAEIISPIQSSNYGKEEYVTVKVICNIASNITLLPLAFKVNNGEVKRQVFRQIVSAPIDTVIVTFKEKIDMSSFGIYNITVYSEFEDDCNRSNDTLRIRIVNNKMSTTLQAYPNPFVSDVNIAIQADGDGIATFSLFDLTGKRIDAFTIDVQEGINQIRYSLPHIPKGIYILRMTLNGKNNSIKIIKQ